MDPAVFINQQKLIFISFVQTLEDLNIGMDGKRE